MGRRNQDDDARWFEENIGRLDTRHIGDKALAHVNLDCAECVAAGGAWVENAPLCPRGRAFMEAWRGVMIGTRVAPAGVAGNNLVKALREMARVYAVSPTTAASWWFDGKLPAVVKAQMQADLDAFERQDDDA